MTAFDPDMDTATYPTSARPEDAADYQRLVANPLLAAVALLGVWVLFRYSLEVRNLGLFLATLFAASVCPFLIQYHCLDCGRTDLAVRSRVHVCPAVIHRRRNGEEPPVLPPTVRAQVKTWAIVLIMTGLLYAIFHHHS
ncbi:hypothetical protein [Planctomyces sp. SH-PL62]|uniref:hypothetical protein n=1 Tax=Planctomyces sp. SH-PL62 TaxID=1636152 RepID=UPI00078DC227|nr:hypothetical protein [Planctomyces sp. SH-PL62]AMV39154.1 hypothetical protein VT85_17080 [Planctomyces sp. SH-PL62]